MTLSRVSPAVLCTAFALALGGATGSAGPQTPAEPPPEDFTALAVNMGNVGPTQPTVVDILIRRWSDEEERSHLVTILAEKGPEALLSALRKNARVGTLRTPDTVGHELRYAHQTPANGGGRRILIVTDRPIGFWEARDQPRSMDYPFMVIDLRIKPDGTGTGTLSLATKVIPVGKTIYLEEYATQPVTLQNVKSKKRPAA